MKKLINEIDAVVTQALSGFVALNPGLALLGESTTVIRSDLDSFLGSGKVALISGGGAGHEPAHAGYIGPGMLTAAVSGNVFSSPSTDAVLDAIRAVGTPAGVLLIVKNYTGDRLNFGLAAEAANAEGIPVELVVVDDDAALGSAQDTAGRRGIAGTVLVHKVAGAAAEAGLPLALVRERAEAAIAAVASMGVALSPCVVPAAGKAGFELEDDEIELGLGIHGEAGVERTRLASSRSLVSTLLDKIIADRQLSAGDSVALLVNNLGATPPMELGIVANDALAELEGRGVMVSRAWGGAFLTAIDMAGVSLSLMKLSPELLDALDAPTSAPAWPRSTGVPGLARIEMTTRFTAPAGAVPHERPAPGLILALTAACDALLRSESMLTELDRRVGDGDIGHSLSAGAHAVLERLPALADAGPVAVLREVAALVRRTVGGTSGPLVAIFALAASNALAREGPAASLASAFSAGVSSVCALGGASAGDRTMVDALLPAQAAMHDTEDDPNRQLAAAAIAADAGARATAQMKPRRGRSSYLGDRVLGHEDPGARAVALLLAAASNIGEG